MPRPSHRDKILTEGLRVVHERGFGAASVRDIVQAAGVPQGSFTNHFASKEEFGLEILDLYCANGGELIRQTLGNESLPPLRRLAAYLETAIDTGGHNGMRNGCLLGNFTAETNDLGEAIRLRLIGIFADRQRVIALCLVAAVAAGELPPDFECDEMAAFIVASLQGASLLAKAQRSAAPVERLKKILFSSVLR